VYYNTVWPNTPGYSYHTNGGFKITQPLFHYCAAVITTSLTHIVQQNDRNLMHNAILQSLQFRMYNLNPSCRYVNSGARAIRHREDEGNVRAPILGNGWAWGTQKGDGGALCGERKAS